MKKLGTQSADGFSVIEALAATALLVIALSPVYSMLQQLSDTASRTVHLTDATQQYRFIRNLIYAGDAVPERLNGWHIGIERIPLSLNDERLVDGYLGGDFFLLSQFNYKITMTKGEFNYVRNFTTIEMYSRFKNPDEAIFSRF